MNIKEVKGSEHSKNVPKPTNKENRERNKALKEKLYAENSAKVLLNKGRRGRPKKEVKESPRKGEIREAQNELTSAVCRKSSGFKTEGLLIYDHRLLSKRNTSIDLYKVIGIILIVISHTVQTLCSNQRVIINMDINHSTTDITLFILSLLQTFGTIGNTIFFISSVWLLIDSQNWKKKKEWKMLVEIWFISVMILFCSVFTKNLFGIDKIGKKSMLKSFFPSLFQNNWYMSDYLLFYPIHPFLNKSIKQLTQREHFIGSFVLFIFTYILGFVGKGPFTHTLFIWIVIYFIISYIKLYCLDLSNNLKLNCLFCILFLLLETTLRIMWNIIGLKNPLFNNQLRRFCNQNNPLLFGFVFSLFNIIRNLKIKPNKMITTISMLSMYIYIIHENIIMSTYYRPLLWNYVFEHFGFNNILLWTFILSFIVFLFGLVCSLLYKYIFQISVGRFVDYSYNKLCNGFDKICNLLIK